MVQQVVPISLALGVITYRLRTTPTLKSVLLTLSQFDLRLITVPNIFTI
jgi:hypothetical protein